MQSVDYIGLFLRTEKTKIERLLLNKVNWAIQ